MRNLVLTLAITLAALTGCGGSGVSVRTEQSDSARVAAPDYVLAERAATKYEIVNASGDLMRWSHGERVAFFLRNIRDDAEGRRLVEEYVGGAR